MLSRCGAKHLARSAAREARLLENFELFRRGTKQICNTDFLVTTTLGGTSRHVYYLPSTLLRASRGAYYPFTRFARRLLPLYV